MSIAESLFLYAGVPNSRSDTAPHIADENAWNKEIPSLHNAQETNCVCRGYEGLQ